MHDQDYEKQINKIELMYPKDYLTDQLPECEYCGSKGKIVLCYVPSSPSCPEIWYFYQCKGCYHCSEYSGSPEEALENWKNGGEL